MFFVTKEMAISQLKFGFFLAFKRSIWPFSCLLLALAFYWNFHLATLYSTARFKANTFWFYIKLNNICQEHWVTLSVMLHTISLPSDVTLHYFVRLQLINIATKQWRSQPKFWGAKLTLGEQKSFRLGCHFSSTTWLDMLKIWGAWPLGRSPWLGLCAQIKHFIFK